MKNYRPPPLVIVILFTIIGLGIYGVKVWYFPTRETWFLVVPLSIVGVALAVWMYPRMEHLYSTRAQRINARVCTLLLVPLMLCAAFGIGIPAAALHVLGPDVQIAATVADKQERFKRCRRQIYLAGYSRRLCVGGREFDLLQEGQRVSLRARVGVFGTFVFALEPASGVEVR
jgi:hypothetical protein